MRATQPRSLQINRVAKAKMKGSGTLPENRVCPSGTWVRGKVLLPLPGPPRSTSNDERALPRYGACSPLWKKGSNRAHIFLDWSRRFLKTGLLLWFAFSPRVRGAFPAFTATP